MLFSLVRTRSPCELANIRKIKKAEILGFFWVFFTTRQFQRLRSAILDAPGYSTSFKMVFIKIQGGSFFPKKLFEDPTANQIAGICPNLASEKSSAWWFQSKMFSTHFVQDAYDRT
jgi:hypothetical protein